MKDEELLATLFQAHPWHGVPSGDPDDVVNAYIEIVPSDVVKYELDKASGHLRIDRPQRYSSLAPSLYGFIPQTYCGDRVAARCAERTGVAGIRGDRDPMDICVLTEKANAHGGFLLRARPLRVWRSASTRRSRGRSLSNQLPAGPSVSGRAIPTPSSQA